MKTFKMKPKAMMSKYEKADAALDKKKGIKENSKKDKAMDKKGMKKPVAKKGKK